MNEITWASFAQARAKFGWKIAKYVNNKKRKRFSLSFIYKKISKLQQNCKMSWKEWQHNFAFWQHTLKLNSKRESEETLSCLLRKASATTTGSNLINIKSLYYHWKEYDWLNRFFFTDIEQMKWQHKAIRTKMPSNIRVFICSIYNDENLPNSKKVAKCIISPWKSLKTFTILPKCQI